MHLVAVDLTTGSMAFCVSKEKSIPAVCNIFDSIMHLQKALRSLREKSWKNNLLFASPSIRRPTIYRIRHVGVIITSCCFFASGFPYWENLKRSSFHQFAAPSLVSAKIIISVFTFSPFQNSVICRGCGAVLYQIISFRGFAFCA